MKIKISHQFALTLLAIIFTLGLTFASIELPRITDSFLQENIDVVNVATGQDEISDLKTEMFLDQYNLRLIGYISLVIIIILIVAGFVTNKKGLTSLGAVALFFPVFGSFAFSMFFLAGLGMLRVIWLPFLDISFDVMQLGNIIFLPYQWLLDFFTMFGIYLHNILPYIFIGIGLLFFIQGTLTWFYTRYQKNKVADFWLYKISRHPQYLGWIIWSFGILFIEGPNIRKMYDLSNSLPWLLSTMIIIGIAMVEELIMSREQGETYDVYRKQTPFLFPIPKLISKIFSFPLQLVFKKSFPERKREIVFILAFYTALAALGSAFYTDLIPLSQNKTEISDVEIHRLMNKVRDTRFRGNMRNGAKTLAEMGGPAVDSLIAMLNHKNMHIRWYCADALGGSKSEKAVQPLINLLNDKELWVARSAAGSLGHIGSESAIQPLISVLRDTIRNVSSYAARALGQIGSKEAIQPLIDALWDKNQNTSRWAAWSLGEIGDAAAIDPIIRFFNEGKNCYYPEIGRTLLKLGSDMAEEVFIEGTANGNHFLRSACFSSFGEMKSEKGLDYIFKSLND